MFVPASFEINLFSLQLFGLWRATHVTLSWILDVLTILLTDRATMSLSPRRLLRPWRKKSFGSILSEAEAEETISAVDYHHGGGHRSKKNHGIIVAPQREEPQLGELQEELFTTQREDPYLGELQEELVSLGSIVTDASNEPRRGERQAKATSPVHHFKKSWSKKVKQRQPYVSQQFDQESNAQESRDDDSSPSPFEHQIQYTYKKTDYRPKEDRNIKELFKVPPPDGTNLRTVQELLEGSDSLPPWLRDMLVEASVKVKQNPCTSNSAYVSRHDRAESSFRPLARFESDDSGISASLSEEEEEGTTVMTSFSELSETMDDSANMCNLFPIYF
jgi:hypothetical protein